MLIALSAIGAERRAERDEVGDRRLRLRREARGVAGAGDRDDRDVVAHAGQRVEHAGEARGLLGRAVGRAAGEPARRRAPPSATNQSPVAAAGGGEHRRVEALAR